MKLSAARWFALLNAFTSRDTHETKPPQPASSVRQQIYPREDTTRVLHITADYPYEATRVEVWTGTFTAMSRTVVSSTTGLIDKLVTITGTKNEVVVFKEGVTTMTVAGEIVSIIPGSTPTAATITALTEVSCYDRATCTPTMTPVPYTCPDGTSGVLSITMQYYSCTAGQTCTGEPLKVETTLPCGCGSSVWQCQYAIRSNWPPNHYSCRPATSTRFA